MDVEKARAEFQNLKDLMNKQWAGIWPAEIASQLVVIDGILSASIEEVPATAETSAVTAADTGVDKG